MILSLKTQFSPVTILCCGRADKRRQALVQGNLPSLIYQSMCSRLKHHNHALSFCDLQRKGLAMWRSRSRRRRCTRSRASPSWASSGKRRSGIRTGSAQLSFEHPPRASRGGNPHPPTWRIRIPQSFFSRFLFLCSHPACLPACLSVSPLAFCHAHRMAVYTPHDPYRQPPPPPPRIHRELAHIISPLLVHPGLPIRFEAVAFIAAAARVLSLGEFHCMLLPTIAPFLTYQLIGVCACGCADLARAFTRSLNLESCVRKCLFLRTLGQIKKPPPPGRAGPPPRPPPPHTHTHTHRHPHHLLLLLLPTPGRRAVLSLRRNRVIPSIAYYLLI